MPDQNTNDPADFGALLKCESPFLIGVRHHSAAMARAMPAILQAFAPKHLLIELPMEFADWLPWLGHNDLEAPVALAGCSEDSADLCFYPFADFSPELAAVRWAIENDVPVTPCDLPLGGQRGDYEREHREPRSDSLLERVYFKTNTRDVGALWERMIETPAATATPEALRKSALLFGWMLRCNDGGAGEYDRRREQHMRECIAKVKGRCAAVVGAYHAAALLPDPMLWSAVEESVEREGSDSGEKRIATALIPYSFAQFDERSGYPAGIRDPLWHQRVFEAADVPAMDDAVADFTVSVCRELRRNGHPLNAADGKEALRMARDLSHLRGLHVAGRGELIESLQTCLTRGELMGIGRAVARAMEEVLVGERHGTLPDDAPRSGLAPHVESLIATLKLPGPDSLGHEKRMRLDPLRSRLDRARVVTFERLSACGIPYAKPAETQTLSHRENLTEVWDVSWQHATAAMVELSAARGATLQQATSGALHMAGLNVPLDDWTAEQFAPLTQAARCGLGDVVSVGLKWLVGPFLLSAGLAELTQAMVFVERVRAGHLPGLPLKPEDEWPPFTQVFQMPSELHTTPLLQAAVSQVEGLVGSEDIKDAAALLDLLLWYQQQDDDVSALEGGRLLWSLNNMAKSGSALMQGAGAAGLLLLDALESRAFSDRLGAWADAAVTRESRKQLQQRLNGAVLLAAPRFGADLSLLDGLETRLDGLADDDFLARLPAMRGGFLILSPAARNRLLRDLLERLPDDAQGTFHVDIDPALSSMRFRADEAGRAAVAELLPELELANVLESADIETVKTRPAHRGRQLSLADRWRLILGAQLEKCADRARSAARALDELYGAGQGEGGRGDLAGEKGGQEHAYPNVREWAEDLRELFGKAVREEVLGQALEGGRAAALSVMADENVTPSIELLEQVLSLKGALPESQMDKLRRLAKRITEELTRELATRLRPALTGLSTPRPSRRPTPRLDLNRTIRANLHTARTDSNGEMTLVPERLIFRSLNKRSMDWHLIFIVDVSGSMEPSVIYSAMMAAIFAGLPAVSVQFLAFSTEVIDFSERVDDPLSMLLEVEVGGGTHIAKGVRAARQRLRVPARSIVLLVTDFEEGWPVSGLLGEVRALVDSGAKSLGIAALSDDGQPRYNKAIAGQVVGNGMPVAALSPLELARWVGEQIR